MALDTDQKRGSVIGLSLPFRPWLAVPVATIGSGERLSLLYRASEPDAGEAEEEAGVGGWIFGRRWFIYPDGRRLYQTEDEARDTLREYFKRKRRRKPKPEKIRAAVEQALFEKIEPVVLADYGLLQQLDLPSIPNIAFDFAPPLIDNTALETVYLRAQDMRAQIERQQAVVARRRSKEAEFLALLLA